MRPPTADILTDARGRKYIDFVMGWCVGNFGWRPAAAVKAKCHRNWLLVSTEGSAVLLLPSLTIDKRTAARGLDILARSI